LMLTQMAENKFMDNYAYVVLEAWHKLRAYIQPQKPDSIGQVLLEAITALEKAEELEPTYSWTVDNVMANLVLVKDGSAISTYNENDDNGNLKKASEVKSKYCEYENRAIRKISKCIETANAVLAFLFAQGKITYTDGYAIQLRAYVKFHEEIAVRLQNNINIVAHSSTTEMVKVKDIVDPEKIKHKIDLKTVVLQNINEASGMEPAARQSLQHVVENFNFTKEQQPIVDKISDQVLAQGGFVVEIEKYELIKEPEDWFGTFFSGLMGIFFLVAGVLLAPYGGVFLQSFAISLISKGVSDIIQTLIAVGTRNPIDLGNYLSSTAMSIGIAIVASSILFFIDKLVPAFGIAGRVAEAANSLNLGTMALIQTSTIAVGTLLGKLGSNFIDEDDIKAKAEAEIGNVINSREEKEALKNIFATDAFNGNSNLIKELYNLVEKVVRQCQEKFQDDETKFGVGVGKNVAGTVAGQLNNAGIGLGNVIQTGTAVVIGGIKNAKALGEVIDGIKAAIKKVAEMALKSGAIMSNRLTKVFDHDNIGVELVGALNSQGYILNGEINHVDCSSLNNVQLNEKLSSYKPGIIEACTSVSKLLLDEYQSSYAALKNDWVNRITGTITSIQKHDIVQPLADGIAVEAGARIGERLHKLITKAVNSGRVVSEIDDKYLQKSPYEKAANDVKNNWFAGKEQPSQSSAPSQKGRSQKSSRSKGQSQGDTTAPTRSNIFRQTDARTNNAFSDITKGFDSYLKKSAFEKAVIDNLFTPNNAQENIVWQKNQQKSTSPFVIWLDGRTSVDESKLAWWVKRNLNMAASVAQPGQNPDQNGVQNNAAYVPLPTATNLNTHWGIELANEFRDVMGYFEDSTVKNDNGLKNHYSKLKLLGHYEVGFDNEIMDKSIKNVASRWDKEKGKQFDGMEYNTKDHNCQHFISYPIFEEYVRNQGKFYVKPVPYNLFHLEDRPR